MDLFFEVGENVLEDEAMLDELNVWREEMQQRMRQESEFMAELRARKDRTNHQNHSSDTDNEQ